MRLPPTLLLLSTLGLLPACGDDDSARPDEVWVEGDRLTIRETSFPGGEPVQLGLYDEVLATRCTFRLAADGQRRCLPDDGGFSFGYYSSADCSDSSAVFEAIDRCGDPPAFGRLRMADSCPTKERVFRLGERVTADRFYYRSGEECFEIGIEGVDLYARGEELAPELMVAGERTPSGGSRLKRYINTSADGARSASSVFLDPDLGEDCFFDAAADGSLRCLPGYDVFFTPSTEFSDAGCSQPALSASPCAPSSFVLAFSPNACETGAAIYELGAPIADGTLYTEREGECEVRDTAADRPVRPIGDEVPPSALAGGEEELRGEGRIRSRWIRAAGAS